jgi:3'-5' exoribonuclease
MSAPASTKGPFVTELRPGERIVGYFIVRQKQLEPFRDRSKGEFLSLILADRTGEIIARVWDDAPAVAETFAEGEIIKVAADVGEYQGRTQLIVQKLRRAEAEEYDLGDFQAATQRDVAAMLAGVQSAARSLGNPHLGALVSRFYDDSDFVARLSRAPAARRVHHAYVGGLLEQLSDMLALADGVLALYPDLNADLLRAGILLHGVGKTAEFTVAGDIDQTDAGRLLGHIVLGDEQVAAAIAEIEGFPDELGLRVRHMLVSQHGKLEWGSPRQPQTLEALILYHLEDLTAQVNRFRGLLERPRAAGQSWTEYNRLLGRQLYIGQDPDADASSDGDDGLPLD